MRVLHVTPYFAPAYYYGGPPSSILGLCQGLQEHGVDVEVLTTSANGRDRLPPEVVDRNEFEGVPVHYLNWAFPRRFFGASHLHDSLRRALTRANLIHLHGLWNVPVWMASLACRHYGQPFVVSPRGMLDPGSLAFRRWRKKLSFQAIERHYLKRAQFLHATSEQEESNLEGLELGRPVVRIPNGVSLPDNPRRVDVRARFGLREEDVLVLYLGRLHPTKRLDLLVSSMERVTARHSLANLLLAGREDGVSPQRVVNFGKSGRVRWIGEVDTDTKWSLLAEAAMLVLCSDSESFGMCVVEAMAAGTPVVVTKTVPWAAVAARGCGLWVEQTIEGLVYGIEHLLDHPEEAQFMGQRGKQLVQEKYSWRGVAREMTEAYQDAVE
jgi:glycosyltransferase involved in cell wall biosynthesis